MKISEVMTTDVQTVTPDQSAREAAKFMLRAEAGSIPVTDGGRDSVHSEKCTKGMRFAEGDEDAADEA